MKAKVSVIVPIYNVEQYFMRCANSLINQTLKELEIIFVDDASPDKCPQICDELAQKYSNIKVIHKHNQGLGMARNSGLEIATGEYVAFLDSDDFVDNEMYESLYRAAKDKNLDFLGCDFAFYLNNGKSIPVQAYKEAFELFGTKTRKLLIDMLGAPPEHHSDVVYQMSVWKAIYKKELLDKYCIKFPSERELIAEDIVFHTDFFLHTERVGYIPKTYYYYCENAQSLTKTYKTNRYLREIKLYQYLEKATAEYKGSEIRLQRTFLGRIRVCLKDAYASGSLEAKNTISKIINDVDVQKVAEKYDATSMYIPYKVFVILLRLKKPKVLALFFKVLSLRRLESV